MNSIKDFQSLLFDTLNDLNELEYEKNFDSHNSLKIEQKQTQLLSSLRDRLNTVLQESNA